MVLADVSACPAPSKDCIPQTFKKKARRVVANPPGFVISLWFLKQDPPSGPRLDDYWKSAIVSVVLEVPPSCSTASSVALYAVAFVPSSITT